MEGKVEDRFVDNFEAVMSWEDAWSHACGLTVFCISEMQWDFLAWKQCCLGESCHLNISFLDLHMQVPPTSSLTELILKGDKNAQMNDSLVFFRRFPHLRHFKCERDVGYA